MSTITPAETSVDEFIDAFVQFVNAAAHVGRLDTDETEDAIETILEQCQQGMLPLLDAFAAVGYDIGLWETSHGANLYGMDRPSVEDVLSTVGDVLLHGA